MRKMKQSCLAAIVLLFGANSAQAQEKIETTVNADIVSQYI